LIKIGKVDTATQEAGTKNFGMKVFHLKNERKIKPTAPSSHSGSNKRAMRMQKESGIDIPLASETPIRPPSSFLGFFFLTWVL
jgi:hypothetical protein